MALNRLSLERRAKVLSLLVEGMSLRSASRIADVSINTILKLLRDVGGACLEYHSQKVRGLKFTRLQCDELTCFIGGRRRNLDLFGLARGWGESYTWTCIEPDTKLFVAWHTGGRTRNDANQFLSDVRSRVTGKVHISTDFYAAYAPEIAECFGLKARHEMFLKHDRSHYAGKTVHTSFVERMNLTIRQSNRRFGRRTSAFSKCPEQHNNMLALYFVYYNFARIHTSLRVTPAMAAGIDSTVWDMRDIVLMAETMAPRGISESRMLEAA